MPRKARKISNSGTYHIICRGIDRSDLFLDDQDFIKYIQILEKFNSEGQYDILAYCLMSNHAHLLMNFYGDAPGKYIHQISTSYAAYYNKKYDRVGHLFQNRYLSRPVEDDVYLLCAVRYIHQNPVKAGICSVSEYEWSSFCDYIGDTTIVAKDQILEMLGGTDAFVAYMNQDDPEQKGYLEYGTVRITDQDALKIIYEVTGNRETNYLRTLQKEKRDGFIAEILSYGVSERQLARITQISRTTIRTAVRNARMKEEQNGA